MTKHFVQIDPTVLYTSHSPKCAISALQNDLHASETNRTVNVLLTGDVCEKVFQKLRTSRLTSAIVKLLRSMSKYEIPTLTFRIKALTLYLRHQNPVKAW